MQTTVSKAHALETMRKKTKNIKARKRLENEFEFVRATFFPRWDKKREWRVELVDDLDGAQGKCFDEEKVVRIAYLLSGDKLTVLLIHEITHAVSRSNHARKFQDRMSKAAQKADTIGRPELGSLLREDVDMCRKQYIPYAAGIYDQIREAVIYAPEATFTQVVNYIRREIGLPKKDFLRQYRRARTVFDEAKEYIKQDHMKPFLGK
jgi:hypothetical protein